MFKRENNLNVYQINECMKKSLEGTPWTGIHKLLECYQYIKVQIKLLVTEIMN